MKLFLTTFAVCIMMALFSFSANAQSGQSVVELEDDAVVATETTEVAAFSVQRAPLMTARLRVKNATQTVRSRTCLAASKFKARAQCVAANTRARIQRVAANTRARVQNRAVRTYTVLFY